MKNNIIGTFDKSKRPPLNNKNLEKNPPNHYQVDYDAIYNKKSHNTGKKPLLPQGKRKEVNEFEYLMKDQRN